MKDILPKVVYSQDFRRNGAGRNRGKFEEDMTNMKYSSAIEEHLSPKTMRGFCNTYECNVQQPMKFSYSLFFILFFFKRA